MATIYHAAAVPRSVRTTQIGFLPASSVIGSKLIRGQGGVNLVMDYVMLPAQAFQYMRLSIGLRHVAAPTLKMGPGFYPAYVPNDTRQVVVPDHIPDPEAYARAAFVDMFGLETKEAGFFDVGQEIVLPKKSPWGEDAVNPEDALKR